MIVLMLGALGVGNDFNNDPSSDSLVFLFKRSQPARVVEVQLTDFDQDEVVLLEFGNDLAGKQDDYFILFYFYLFYNSDCFDQKPKLMKLLMFVNEKLLDL